MDIIVFQLLKHYHAKAVDLTVYNGCSNITKLEFLGFIQDVQKQASIQSTITSSFRKTGIIPFNSEIVLGVKRARKVYMPIPELDPALLSSPFGIPITLRQIHKVPAQLEGQLNTALEIDNSSILFNDTFVNTVSQFIRGAIANSPELVQIKRDLGRTCLAEETRRKHRAMQNSLLKSGGGHRCNPRP